MTSRRLSPFDLNAVDSMVACDPVLRVCDDATLPDLLAEIDLLVTSARELAFANLDKAEIESTDLDWLPYHLLGQVAALVHAAERRALQQQNADQLTLLSQ